MAISNDPLRPDPSRASGDEATPITPYCEQAERYRLMADEVRAAAEEMRDVPSRQTLNRIAEDYERLALRSERRSRGNNHPGSRNHR